MAFLWTIIVSNVCGAQQPDRQASSSEPLYPYLGKDGRYGYVEAGFRVGIPPQYRQAGPFNEQGYAVVVNDANQYGVINTANEAVIPLIYEHVSLTTLEDYTVAETQESYSADYRFWDWRFLPGFNIIGGTGDKRLFDTKVTREKRTLWVLGPKNRKIASKAETKPTFGKAYFRIITLENNRLWVDGHLYAIGGRGARRLASHIKIPSGDFPFLQHLGNKLRVVDRNGKPIDRRVFTPVDSVSLKMNNSTRTDISLTVKKNRQQPILYHDGHGNYYCYPDFGKPLPDTVQNTSPDEDGLSAQKVLQEQLWMMAPVPKGDYFVLMNFDDGTRFFRFLDTQGNMHRTLPTDIPFSVTVEPTGSIIWPDVDHYIGSDQVPEGWSVHSICLLDNTPLHIVTLQKDKTQRQGVWNVDTQQWHIAPDHYSVAPLGSDFEQWAFQPDNKDDLWGIIDARGDVKVPPRYRSISPDGYVRIQADDGHGLSFYLHLPSLRELREH